MSQGFKDALARWASGVSVVATRDDQGQMYGLTVSSFSSVSLDPPIILVCIDNRSRFIELAEANGGFAVSILHTGQEDVSNAFARSGREPSDSLEGFPTHVTDGGQPVVEGAMAWLSCKVHALVPAGDHTLVLGAVEETDARDGQPLLYYRRAYRTVTD